MPSTDPYNDQPQDAKSGRRKNPVLIVLINIALMVIVGLVIIWLSMMLLRIYTRHNDSVEVPKLNGLTQQEAAGLLRSHDLEMEVVDSVYNETMPPGAILESTPKAGSSVKSNRTIFVTVNTTLVKQARVPDVFEVSRRQAEAALRRAGFVNIREEYVPGVYSDLAMSVKDGNSGAVLRPETTVAYNLPIILEVTSSKLMDSLSLAQDPLDTLLLDEMDTANSSSEADDTTTGNDWF